MDQESAQKYILARSKLDESGCRLWTASVASHGYGNAFNGTKIVTAHRMSYEAFVGPIPLGAHVLHSCNARSCVEPTHLRLGTHVDNMDDIARGKYHGRRKLTSEQAREVKSSKDSLSVLARRFGMSKSSIAAIRKGRFYRYD